MTDVDTLVDELAGYLGARVDAARAEQVITMITALARGYTRGVGFGEDGEPAEDVGAVILAASARLLNNPNGIGAETMGPFSVTYGPAGGFNWSVGERLALDRYRVKAQ